jgi:hypothetical protein
MSRLVLPAALALMSQTGTVSAAEIGHFAPGVLGIRDFAVPEPGFYGVLYNYYYSTDRLNDADGNEVDSVTINPGPGPGVTLDLEVDVDVYAIAPTVIWVSSKKVLGAKYAAYISPSFSDSSVAASLSTASGTGRSAEGSHFDMADLFVQPLWLGWTQEYWDFALGYGFYAPTGHYDTETISLPVVGPVTVEASDNIGLGFWTHQFQGAASWYPWTDRRMAVVSALTYETNGKKEDFDVTPGDVLTLSWGVDQYLPLMADQSLLLDLGLAGYSSWQVSNDSGADATIPAVKDEVHAIGVQVGLTHVPTNTALTFHYLNEFDSKDRFQGESVGLNFAMKF